MKRALLIAAMSLCCAGAAHAEVFKCKGPDGKFAYQDGPCSGSSTGGAVDLKVHEPSAAEIGRARAQAIDDSYRLRRIERDQAIEKRAAEAEHARAERAKERERVQCARDIARADRAERNANNAYSERAREYYRDQSRELRDRHFSNCR